MVFQTTKGALRRRPEAPVEALPGSEGTRARMLSNAVVARNNTEGYANEIGKLWGEAQQKFLTIGRYLILAKEKLEHGEFERMVSTMLPFGRNVAHRLRVVAAAVEQGRLPEEALPRSYTVAYGLVILSEQEFEEVYRPRLMGHLVAAYAARAAVESWSCRMALGGLNPCRSISQVVL